jgi:hypothetical protein
MAAAVPFLDHIAGLRRMPGEPLVTFPWQDRDFPVVERLELGVAREKLVTPDAPFAFGAADPDTVRFPTLVLSDIREVGGNRTNVDVWRRWEVLPGFTKVTAGYDPETGAKIFTSRQRVRATAVLPAVGFKTTIAGVAVSVTDAYLDPEGDYVAEAVIEYMETPDPQVDYVDTAITFPGIARWSNTIYIPGNYPGEYRPPFAGDGVSPNTVNLQKPRARRVVGRRVRTYSLGPSGSSEVGFAVYTPGTASRVFNIQDETVHPAFKFVENVNGTLVMVEDLPASTPAYYDPRQVLRLPAGERKKVGLIYEKTLIEVSEATAPTDFDPVLARKFFAVAASGSISAQPGPGGERLVLSSSGADTRTVTLHGIRDTSRGRRYFRETVTLSGTTKVLTSATKLWFSLRQAVASDSHGSNVITIASPGSIASGLIYGASGTAVPADGDTIVVGLTAATRTYTFRNPGFASIEALAASGITTGDYFDVLYGSVTTRFWYDKASGGGAPANPGGGLHAIALAGSESTAQVMAATVAVLNTALSGTVFSIVSEDVILLVRVTLGTLSLTDGAGGAATGFTFSNLFAGTAEAPNQIRTGVNSAGEALTLAEVFGYVERAVNGTGTEGTEYGTGTARHSGVTARAESTGREELVFTGSVPYSAGTWVLTASGTVLTSDGFTDGADGQTLATIAANARTSFLGFSTQNQPLLAAGSATDDEEADPTLAVGRTVPAATGSTPTVTTAALALPGVQNATLVLCASGERAIGVTYQTSADGVTWNTAVTCPSVADGRIRKVGLGATAINYLRLNLTNPAQRMRGFHAHVEWALGV